ncbi:MAG: aminotransferase class I/II-fold pyridoxal phosphate-dependent enzyme, partial [Novosphingobium sp.]
MKRTTGQDRSITRNWRPATQAVRGGTWRSEMGETSEAIFLTSGFAYDNAETAAMRFRGEDPGMTYSRLQNPTVAMLEERIALMDGAEACRVQASGMAAMTAAMLCQLQAGDHVVAGRAAFGSCRWLVDQLLPRFGITTTTIDARDNAQWEAAIQPNTKVFFFETPANPTMDVVDIRAVCDLARAHGIRSVVDNAFATAALQRPLDLGADVVAYAATKLM